VSPPPQGEVVPARKKPRIEEPLPTPTDEATTENTSHATTVALPSSDGAPSIGQTTANAGQWTTDDDKKLKDAVPTHGAKNWEPIAALSPGRTKVQCRKRWYNALDPSIYRATACVSKWTADEDKKLKDTVPTHGAKNWETIAALVPGRTKVQCRNRWHNALDPSIYRATACVSKWTADEDKKLKDAVPRIGRQLPRWSQIERKGSVKIDGVMPWILASTRRRHVWLDGQQTKTRC
jgi:predicted lipoprotein with Yx(FWY)xxD motif